MQVLLIEDNEDDVLLIKEQLAASHEGSVELEHANRLATGLERLARGGIEVVLTDLHLPDSQALDTFDQVYAKANGIPVIVVTGTYQEGAIALEAIKRGAQDYVVKEELS